MGPTASQMASPRAPISRLSRSSSRPGAGLPAGRVALLGVLLAAALVACAAGVKTSSSAEAEAPRAASPRVSLGIFIKGGAEHFGLYDDYARRTGHAPVLIGTYREWNVTPFHPDVLRNARSRGAVPFITWEPYSGDQAYPLSNIASGKADGRIRDAARAARHWGRPIFLRFAQEPNGQWFPWGKQPAAYVAAWRRMWRIFREEGANNVRWVWNPYVNLGKHPFKRYFPGNRYVDWVALDGFNWKSGWRSFEEIFMSSYRTLARMSPRPIMIPEVGTYGSPRRKVIWVKRMLNRALPRMRRIRAVMWWSDIHRNGDLRVHTEPAVLRALRRAMNTRRYSATRRTLLSVPRRLR